MATDPGVSFGFELSTSGIRNAPQALMKVTIAVTPMPGIVSGTMIRRRMRRLLAPSIEADSSSSSGTASMKFFISQIANGSDDAARKIDVQKSESSQPNVTNSWYVGTIAI